MTTKTVTVTAHTPEIDQQQIEIITILRCNLSDADFQKIAPLISGILDGSAEMVYKALPLLLELALPADALSILLQKCASHETDEERISLARSLCVALKAMRKEAAKEENNLIQVISFLLENCLQTVLPDEVDSEEFITLTEAILADRAVTYLCLEQERETLMQVYEETASVGMACLENMRQTLRKHIEESNRVFKQLEKPKEGQAELKQRACETQEKLSAELEKVEKAKTQTKQDIASHMEMLLKKWSLA